MNPTLMTISGNTHVPILRFSEFSEKWKKKHLEEITNWASGGTPSKENSAYWNGSIPWISASSMRGLVYSDSDRKVTEAGLNNGSKLALKGSILLLVRGSMLFNTIPVGITARDVAFNQDVKSITIKGGHLTKYILYWFIASENKLLDMVVGTGIGAGKLELSDLKKLIISLPSLPEQQKIASFLTDIDAKIELLSKKKALLEQYKKGVMQQLFSQKVRFKNEIGEMYPEWEEVQFEEVFERITRKNQQNNTNVLTISAQQGLVSQTDYFNKSVASQDLTGYYLLKKGDFAYNKSYSNGYPLGAIKRLTSYAEGVVSTLYICFRAKDSRSVEFYDFYLNSGFMNHEIQKIAQEGARNHGLLNVSVVEFFRDISLVIPSIDEQQRIASFLVAFDEKIGVVDKQIALNKAYKRGLLQQLFV